MVSEPAVPHFSAFTLPRQHGARTERLKTGAEYLQKKLIPGRAEFFAPPRQGYLSPLTSHFSPITSHLIVPRSLVSIKVMSSLNSGDSGKLRPISANACLVFSFAR